MQYENTRRFTDPAVLKRLAAIEASPEHQQQLAQVKEQMQQNRINRLIAPFVLGLTLYIAFGIFRFTSSTVINGVLLVAFLVVGWFGYRYYRQKVREFAHNNEQAYLEHVLLPVLCEVVPDTTVDYHSGIQFSLLKPTIPQSEKYQTGCHISFGDTYKTEFCNVYAYHIETDSDDNKVQVTDFLGQAFLAHCTTELRGHVRIIPTTRGLFGRELQIGYDKTQHDEKKLELEDIQFNETHNVYCTDELSARRLLNPYLLSLLDEWVARMPVAVYMTQEMLVVSFSSNQSLLQIPTTAKEIDMLSLTAEYQKVQEGLSNTYRLLDTIVQQV